MKKQWQLLDPNPQTVASLSNQIGCSPLIARLLVIRGIQSKSQALRFLSASLGSLTPPFELAGMQNAVQRIRRALATDEKILVFGDYDADGITATALLISFLRQCGAQVSYAIPHRISEGYGMGVNTIKERAIPAGVGLIITVDCGSSSAEAVTLAHRAGIHTIITDHHPVAQLPKDAHAVINPTRPDCHANLAHLAGVGVAFYLIIALRAHLRENGFWKNRREPNLKQLCDLVALGTVADVAPLVAENRALTAVGLEQINQGTRPGLAALIKMSGSPDTPTDTQAIAFRLAPRLNAAGRLVHARMACELLLTHNHKKAARLASVLCRLNSRRQSMENNLLESILTRLTPGTDQLNRPVLVMAGNGWHEGILGIVASRLTRQFNRPAVVISTKNGIAKGSARSTDGIDISLALHQCADLLDRFGGHPLAAGFSIEAAKLAAFKDRLETIVGQLSTKHGLAPTLSIDAKVRLDAVTPEMMNSLDRLGPFGQGNPYPLFMDTDVGIHTFRNVGERHRQMILQSGSGKGAKHPAIAFNVTGDLPVTRQFEKIAYRPQWNYWRGRKSLQLIVEDTEPVS